MAKIWWSQNRRSRKEIAIQVNGKVRDTIKININTSKEELEKTALSRENIKSGLKTKSSKGYRSTRKNSKYCYKINIMNLKYMRFIF